MSMSMTTIVLVGAAIVLAVAAIIAAVRASKPKKAEKWEKAQIVKRLVMLSENENKANGISRQPSASQRPALGRGATAGRS
jgi:hypothetical protein